MRRHPELIALLLIALSAGAAETRKTDSLRPTGPVTVTADRAQFEQGRMMIYTGHVLLVSDTLKLSGDRLDLQQYAAGTGGGFDAHMQGAPARMDHAGEVSPKGEPAQPISAQAANLNYDARTGVVEISGHASMTRGKDEITGDNIRYNVAARRIEAAGGKGGQVRIVLQPPPEKGEKKK